MIVFQPVKKHATLKRLRSWINVWVKFLSGNAVSVINNAQLPPNVGLVFVNANVVSFKM